MIGPQITLTEAWMAVNQPGLTGAYDQSLPAGPRGKKASAPRIIQWDPTQQRLVEPCPKAPRPDFWAWKGGRHGDMLRWSPCPTLRYSPSRSSCRTAGIPLGSRWR